MKNSTTCPLDSAGVSLFAGDAIPAYRASLAADRGPRSADVGARSAVGVDETPVADPPADLTYSSYLALDEVLTTQRPLSGAHDEMMFIVIHQVHELWFKLLLHEFADLQRRLSTGDTAGALHSLRRSLAVLKVVISQIDVMETLTPAQFAAFRGCLGTASGFQSAQFREVETVLGRRDRAVLDRYKEGGAERGRIEAAMNRPSLFDSFLQYLAFQGYPVPVAVLYRDVSLPLEPSAEVQDALLEVHLEDGVAAQVCEGLIDLDQRLQEWRYRHGKMVERIIGHKTGTGGSSGASYLFRTLATPMFPDLWAVRSRS
ncbi:tryptophan 2,3-dioxygenase family protein [Planotetraspora sp. A-T 1434]|uniref:tryptophan 2,3-dioxygenase n=1 Tax=Planotetraspora sp. A-T 1434 TaxID=2979219 RepID=UPI0021C14C7B|nr:tryptophan 2,3-dioxygenase family protein [Planotetraspora sp. A-T 1434]MCT9933215.1 tryptophan 2,3-dioxygenase family protein [Planotetraspora sp. A-T 1434]